MNDFSELNEHAAKLTRQIDLIRTGLGIDEINKKAEAIEREIGELRHDNNRLTRENEELKGPPAPAFNHTPRPALRRASQ